MYRGLSESSPEHTAAVLHRGARRRVPGFPPQKPPWSVIQQTVPHGPDHDLLLRAKTQLALYAVEGVPDGHRLDPSGLRNRVVTCPPKTGPVKMLVLWDDHT